MELIVYLLMIEFFMGLCGDDIVMMIYDYVCSELGYFGISLYVDG